MQTLAVTKVSLVASIIIVAFSQQISTTATPSTAKLKGAKTLSRSSRSAQFYIECGRKHSRLFQFEKAVANYSIAIKMLPHSSWAYVLRADAYRDLGQYQKQIDDFTSAIKIHPKLAVLYEKRADAYYQLGQLQNAIADATTATSLNPTSAGGYRLAASAYEDLGLYEQSIAMRTKLLGLKTSSALDWSSRAQDYEALGKFALAQSDRQKAAALASPDERNEMELMSPLIDFNEHAGAEPKGKPKDSIARLLKNNPAVMSFQYDPEGHICVPATVNGHPVQLMLDTGCGLSDIWKKAMPEVAKFDQVRIGTFKNGQNIHSFKAGELKVDNLTLTNLPMVVDKGLASHRTLSGFLGGNILENLFVTVDYSKKQLILASSLEDVPKSPKAIVVPMRMRYHRPYCAVRLDGKLNVVALLDTGSPANIAADSLIKPILPRDFSYSAIISGPSLGNVTVGFVRLKNLEVGGSKFEAPLLAAYYAQGSPSFATHVILGNSFLSTFKTVTFNYPAREIIFEKSDTPSESAPSLIAEGNYYLAQNQEQRAVDTFNRAMILDNDFAESCHMSRAQAFMQIKQYKQAISELDAVIKLNPQSFRSYQYRAECYSYLGDHANQINDDSAVIRLRPSFCFPYIDRARAYEKLGKHRLAKQDRLMFDKLLRTKGSGVPED